MLPLPHVTPSSLRPPLAYTIPKGFIREYLIKDAPCYPISNQWCYLIAVTDGFVLLLGVLQFYQLWVLICSYGDIMPPLKAKHREKAKKTKKKNPKRRQRKPQEDAMSKRETKRRARRHSPHLLEPEKAYIPPSYDIEMASMEGWDQRHPQTNLQHHARHHAWPSKTGTSTTVSHQTSSRRKRGNDRYDPSLQGRNRQPVQGTVFMSTARHQPGPAFTHPSAPRTQYHRSPSNTSRRKQIIADTTGARTAPKIIPYPETDTILDHRNPPSLPRSKHRSPSSRPGASVAPSIHRTVTVASSHRSRRHLEEHHVPEVSPMSSYEDLSRLTPHERALVEPSICSSDHPQPPVIKVTPCSSGRNSIASQGSNDCPPSYSSGETTSPRESLKEEYNRLYGPSDADNTEAAGSRAGHSNTLDPIDDNEEHLIPDTRLTDKASPPPYENDNDSKVWDWFGKTKGKN